MPAFAAELPHALRSHWDLLLCAEGTAVEPMEPSLGEVELRPVRKDMQHATERGLLGGLHILFRWHGCHDVPPTRWKWTARRSRC